MAWAFDARVIGLAMATLSIVLWREPPATPEAPPSRLDADLEQQLERAVGGRLGLSGLEPVRRESGALLVGESRDFEIQLRRGESFLAVGACDESCVDLDLVLTGPRDVGLYADRAPDVFPVVGAVAQRSGVHTVRVEMAVCPRRCRFSLAFLVTPVADPDERDRLEEASRIHAAMVVPIRDRIASDGRRLRQLASIHQPTLAGGSDEAHSVEVPWAGRVLIAAACDLGCEDLDLFLEDASGDELAGDRHPGPEPVLWAEVPAPGSYRLVVRMEHCIDEPCAYAASVLAEEPEGATLGGGSVRGSCFAAHPAGLVATAAHVVSGATALRVHLADGAVVDAEIHAMDAENDLAVLNVGRATPEHLPLAPEASARLGLRVFTLGFPAVDLLGEDPKFGEGVVAGVGNGSSAKLQITVPIQPGSSGAPLVTEQGLAVGVIVGSQNVAFFRAITGQHPQSVNFAARSELLARLLPPASGTAPPLDRAQAIERARAAACRVEALGARDDSSPLAALLGLDP